tara:strand:+ start:37 stop:465 length:429 start_codon:yes stop_codon:yes gene_type:complete
MCVFIFLSLNLRVVRAQELLQVQERDLYVSGGFQQIAELLVEDEDAPVVGVLEIVRLYVLVDGASDGATRDELAFREIQEYAKFLGDLLFSVEAVVFSAVSRLLAGRIVLLSLDLSYNLSQRLKFITERGHFGEDGFNGHCI